MNIKKSKLTSSSGFTLIEMMFSCMLFAIVVSSSFFGIITAHQMTEDSRSKVIALNAARSVLEAVKDTSLANVPSINTAAFIPADLPNGAVTLTTNPSSVAGAQIATVTVSVTWTGSKNRAQQLDITTMRSRF